MLKRLWHVELFGREQACFDHFRDALEYALNIYHNTHKGVPSDDITINGCELTDWL